MYKIWNKRTLHEIYFRPLTENRVEIITYHNGEPYTNPRKMGDAGIGNAIMSASEGGNNIEVWDIQDARENWDAWVNHGGYEVSEVEDYLRPGSMNLQKRATKTKNERQRRIKQRVKSAMTGYDKLKRMNNEE